MNGLEGPLLKQFGCQCNRCNSPGRQANTSMSFIVLDEDGETAQHILFDIGLGVMDSMLENPYLKHERARLDWLVLSHWHPDHTLEMNRLLVSYGRFRKRGGKPTDLVPMWCRKGTATWLQKAHDFEWNILLDPQVSDENHPPGVLLAPIPANIDGVTITPVTVTHHTADRCLEQPIPTETLHIFKDIAPSPISDTVQESSQECYACASFIIETPQKKAVLLWDIDRFNEWLAQPETAEQETAVSKMAQADYLFIDTCYWQAARTTHPSFMNVKRYVRTLQPKQTYLMHLSGHPDEPGQAAWGWTNAEWQAAARDVWAAEDLPGQVSVPEIGDEYLL